METEAGTNGGKAPSPVRGGLVAYLQVDGAMKAAEFYRKAFGAETESFHPIDDEGRTMHVHLYVNGSSLMLGDAYPEHGYPLEKPQAFTIFLPLSSADIDAWWKRAVDAGLEVVVDLQVMFWGDRYGQLRDPFGVAWAMNAPVK
ncbi:VOC family protein [Rhizobium puerariae]|uniref:VOC family protein n=1 Tax=Rhizobium puerariae TaxID=1585791 RepID=A0ABV6AFM5_9HYPH